MSPMVQQHLEVYTTTSPVNSHEDIGMSIRMSALYDCGCCSSDCSFISLYAKYAHPRIHILGPQVCTVVPKFLLQERALKYSQSWERFVSNPDRILAFQDPHYYLLIPVCLLLANHAAMTAELQNIAQVSSSSSGFPVVPLREPGARTAGPSEPRRQGLKDVE